MRKCSNTQVECLAMCSPYMGRGWYCYLVYYVWWLHKWYSGVLVNAINFTFSEKQTKESGVENIDVLIRNEPLQRVDKFCYLENMTGGGGGADSSSNKRLRVCGEVQEVNSPFNNERGLPSMTSRLWSFMVVRHGLLDTMMSRSCWKGPSEIELRCYCEKWHNKQEIEKHTWSWGPYWN